MFTTRRSDHVLEIAYSCVRWFFVPASTILFLTSYHQTTLDLIIFFTLFVFAVIYMGITEFALHRSPIDSAFYRCMTRIGVVMDYVAFIMIVSLTGGTQSPLYPIAYLILLHASLYWSFIGAMVATNMVILGYVGIVLLVDGGFSVEDMPRHLFNFAFLIMIGVIGGIIVARERKHFVEKGIFENLSKKDYLTGLYNHRSFQEQIKEIIAKKHPFSLVMGDIDYFKQINDQYGHQIGDAVLRAIGNLLDSIIPTAQGSAFRYGGEEFAIIFYTEDKHLANDLLHQFRDKLRALEFSSGEDKFHITMSFGATVRSKEQMTTELVASTDALLYEAKEQGRDRLVWG
ncbi:diguanylate cyclase (GGDEF) domain-containing protein [Paenibacillus sp. yr247]|uniref:GGDEF domain-containing protein n=1 Tax=Paenibacillus sp. yr247 TaxID=1761880 RepID=UPI000890C0F4|nr:diguanylate cyclase [Paenibacillus sp. yr247]SDO03108.1 diguanylate cyclase (GGDEF) domain-containing protein [Paenibacillus sp. yr247]